MLSDRVSHGWQHTRNQAKAVKPPFGYRVEADKYWLADRRDQTDAKNNDEFLCLISTGECLTKADLSRDTIDTFLRVKGVCATIREINTKYGIQKFSRNEAGGNLLKHGFHWSKSGLTDWLHNPILQGHTCYLRRKERKAQCEEKWDVKPNTHPDAVLLTLEQYEEIKGILAANKMNLRGGGTGRRYAVAGLIYCADCRAKFFSVSGKKHKDGFSPRYFQCRNYSERACTNKKLIRAERVEEAIITALVNRHNYVADELNELNRELASRRRDGEVEEKLGELRTQLQGLLALGRNPAFDLAKAQIKNQIKVLEERGKLTTIKKYSTDKFLQSLNVGDKLDRGTLFAVENTDSLHKLIRSVSVRAGEVVAVELNSDY